MATPESYPESLILGMLRQEKVLTLDEIRAGLPQLQWSQLFHAVDGLSRRGQIILRRKGFEYELRTAGSAPLRREWREGPSVHEPGRDL